MHNAHKNVAHQKIRFRLHLVYDCWTNFEVTWFYHDCLEKFPPPVLNAKNENANILVKNFGGKKWQIMCSSP